MRYSFLCTVAKNVLLLTGAFLLFPGIEANAQCALANQQPNPFPTSALRTINVAFTLTGPCASTPNVRVQVVSDSGGAVLSNPTNEDSVNHDYSLSINLFSGNNTIRVFGLSGGALTLVKEWTSVSCTHPKCNDALSLAPASVVGPLGAAPAAAAVAASKITIDNPTVPTGKLAFPADKSTVDAYVTVARSAIAHIQYDVIHEGKVAFTSGPFDVNAAANSAQVPITFRVLRGQNTIRVYDADHPGGGNDATVAIECLKEKCVESLDLATISMDSQNRRLIVGFEQAGASSADSTTKPFLDLYFTAPFVFKPQTKREKELGLPKVPFLGAWSQIRLAATPEQLTNIGVIPSNLVNQIGQTPTRTSLVQSFDFLAGLEARIFTGNGSFQSLIPGVKQKTRFYIAGGGGAISPLNATKENATFFTIPTKESPQYQTFLDRYGPLPAEVKDAAGKETQVKTTVAFVPLDRDRFLRQWYAGIRLKTFYCENDACTTFRNRFPGIADFMIGQSEAVTGGSLFYRVPDPNDPTKTLGEKRAFVFRIDGFYPLPFKQASFVYLYGTAIMKIGAGGVKVSTPLILQPVDRIPLLDDKEVFIPTLDKLKSHQPNRDYYKIGVGINLTDFFNRNKPQ